MRALTIRQPWATLVVTGEKQIETRPFRPRTVLVPGQWFAVHAGLTRVDPGRLVSPRTFEKALARHGVNHWGELPLGALVGFVRYRDATPTENLRDGGGPTERGQMLLEWLPQWPLPLTSAERTFGNYDPDRWGWQLAEPRRLPQPVPCVGGQGIWALRDDLRVEALRILNSSGQTLYVE